MQTALEMDLSGMNFLWDEDERQNTHTPLAIIGGGVAAVTLLVRLRTMGCDLPVVIFDRRADLGRGRAFRYDAVPTYANSYSTALTVDAEHPGDFERWLTDQHGGVPKDHIALRGQVGDYLRETLKSIEGTTFVDDQIATLAPNPTHGPHRLITQQGRVFTADQVVVATGTNRPTDPYGLIGHPRHIDYPYPVGRPLTVIPPTADVAIIGSSLSACEIAALMAERGHTGRLLLCSRRGLLPPVKTNTPGPTQLRHLTPNMIGELTSRPQLSLVDVLNPLHAEFAAWGISAEQYTSGHSTGPTTASQFAERIAVAESTECSARYAVTTSIHRAVNYLWPHLDQSDLGFVRQVFVPQIRANTTALPIPTAKRLLDALGNIVQVSGVTAIKPEAQSLIVHSQEGTHRVDYGINATGTTVDMGPLIDSLAGTRHSRLDPRNNQLIVGNQPIHNLYVHGAATRHHRPFQMCMEEIVGHGSLIANSIARWPATR